MHQLSLSALAGLAKDSPAQSEIVTAPAEDQALLQVFEAAPQDVRGVPAKKAAPDYFL